ncbi:MAG: YceI family protein [Streptosporangiaceae bacterium]
MARATSRRWAARLAALVVAVAVLIAGGTFVYIHFIEGPAPAPLSLHAAASAGASTSGAGNGGAAGAVAAASSVAGRWQIGSGSVVGYRVKEVLFGQDNIAVGRSSSVAGDMTIKGAEVTSGRFTVQMATIRSDQSQRDVQFRGRIMDTSAYPTGTFALTRPVPLGALPASGVIRTYAAAGELTLHGHTRPVTFTLSAERAASGIEVSGSIPVLFANWDIPNPGFGTVITTQNHGELEFLLKFRRT